MGASDDAGEGPIDNRFDEVFGDAHSRLLGKAVKRGLSGKLNRNPLAHEKVSSHTDSWDNQYGDWGVDKEAEDLFEEGVSDDDASFVAEEQVSACRIGICLYVFMLMCSHARAVPICSNPNPHLPAAYTRPGHAGGTGCIHVWQDRWRRRRPVRLGQ